MIALYYGGGDFEETLHIITMCGVDVDCNAGMIMPLIAITKGVSVIPQRLLHPAFSSLRTYMRGRFREMTLEELVHDTFNSIKKANIKKEETK